MINYAKDQLKIYQGNWVAAISCVSGDGYGDGFGDGTGNGFGYGHGYVSGSGDGSGRKLNNGLDITDD